MSHSFYRIWLHVIFSTKHRQALIKQQIEENIYSYIATQMKELGCIPYKINGMPDHIHILHLQSSQKSISEIVKQIKGSSSHWINQNNLTSTKFSWQTGFGVFSVSESKVNTVANYVQNQKEHHKNKSFVEEYNDLIKLHSQAHIVKFNKQILPEK